MVYQQITRLIFFLLCAIIKNATSICKISLATDILRIKTGDGPLIYTYRKDGSPVFSYPAASTDCLFSSEDLRLHLACSSPNATMLFHQKVGNADQENHATLASVYVTHDPTNAKRLRVHGGPKTFTIVKGSFVKCSDKARGTMEILSTNKLPAKKGFVVGYRLNNFDMLKVFHQVFHRNKWVVTRARVKAAIQSGPKFGENADYGKGLFFQATKLNFTEIFSKEHQQYTFQQQFDDVDTTMKYFKNNQLVVGQLIFKEDMYYFSEQASTRYYENTAPIWKSVYEGNWRLIGEIIRKRADETGRDQDVFVTVAPSFLVDFVSSNWVLGRTNGSQDALPVPRILVKAAVDAHNHKQGLVFHTFNDPHANTTIIKRQMGNFCSRISGCHKMHRQFEDTTKGYTFCCLPVHSYYYNSVLHSKESSVDDIDFDKTVLVQ